MGGDVFSCGVDGLGDGGSDGGGCILNSVGNGDGGGCVARGDY